MSNLQNGLNHLRDMRADTPFARDYQKTHSYTMCSNARLRSLHDAVLDVSRRGIVGSVVECGTARGGSAALLGMAMQRAEQNEKLWVFDTFEGLPPATEKDPSDAMKYTGQCRGSIEEVSDLLHKLGIENVELVKGLVQETLPQTLTGPIAVLHVDTDWYDSVLSCLEHLYPKVQVGGFIQIDDYGYWSGARKAVDQFFAGLGIDLPLNKIDYAGRSFIKPST
jgi:O-methyltransferase